MFILMPFLTKTLGIYDYGIWSQVNITIGLALSFVGLGLPYAMIRFLSVKTDKKEIREEFYSVLLLVSFVALTIAFTLILFCNFIANTFFEGAIEIVRISGFIILVWSLDCVYLSFFRTFRRMGEYCAFTVAQKFGEIGLILYFVINGHGILGAVISILTVRSLLLIILFLLIRSEIGIKRPHFWRIKEYLNFGVPTISGNISSWVVTSSDRFIIGYFLGLTSVGIYTVGYRLGNFLSIPIGIISFVLVPTLSKLYDEGRIKEVKTYLRYLLKYFLLLAIPFFCGTIVFSKQVLEVLSTREIADQSYFIVPFIAISILISGIGSIISHILVLTKRTKIIGVTWIFAALVNLLLNILIIPYLGILGAAITTLIAYLLARIITTYYSLKELTFRIEWQFIIKSLIASSIMSLIIWKINPVEISAVILTIFLGIIIYGITLILLRGFEKKEIRFFREIIGYHNPNM